MSVERVGSIAELRAWIAASRAARRRIGLVPTMGALHRGHAALISRAASECERTVVTIFVNPLQFDRKDDLTRYPRTLDEDMRLCSDHGADVVFTPTVAEMYPSEPKCMVHVKELSEHLCGRFRPGHFDGVATVVLKLLQIAQADVAYFGQKDAQQLAIIRRLVADFNVPVTIAGVETVREDDGLAMSSRNAHLDACERKLAASLYRALQTARAAVEAGATDPVVVKAEASSAIPADERLRLEYLELVAPDTMQPVEQIVETVIAAGALWVGRTRLIDNVSCTPPR